MTYENLCMYCFEDLRGQTTCPHCGAPSGNRFVCDYCGMQIAEDDGKIRVASANDIPDPIIEARELIYERHSTIVSKYNSDSSDRVLSGILDLFSGEGSSGLGERMSKEEITEAAELYGVSISSYLNGLDNGVYQTLAAKKKADSAGTITGYGTAAAVGGLIGHNIGQAPPPKPVNHPMPPQQSRPVRPERRNQQKPGNSDFVRKPRQGGKPQGPHGGPRQK